MEYVTEFKRREISLWYEKDLQKAGQVEFHNMLRLLSVTPREQWTRPDYAPLSGGIGEIRFKAGDLQHRPLGFFIIEEMQFVLLVGATKKMKIYTPKDAIETAKARRQIVLANRNRMIEYDKYKL